MKIGDNPPPLKGWRLEPTPDWTGQTGKPNLMAPRPLYVIGAAHWDSSYIRIAPGSSVYRPSPCNCAGPRFRAKTVFSRVRFCCREAHSAGSRPPFLPHICLSRGRYGFGSPANTAPKYKWFHSKTKMLRWPASDFGFVRETKRDSSTVLSLPAYSTTPAGTP